MSVDSHFFETALICENGDLITPCLESNPLLYSDFCEICSAKTISKCPSEIKPPTKCRLIVVNVASHIHGQLVG